ncbi:hypothetical protein D9M71_762270 [compost metagenome]
MGRVDVDAEAVGVLLQQRLGAFGESACVLRHVLRRDLRQRLLAREGLQRNVADLGAGGSHALHARPGRDAAVGVAGHLATQRVERLAQRGGLIGAHRRLRTLCAHQYGSQRRPQSRFLVHCRLPRLGD